MCASGTDPAALDFVVVVNFFVELQNERGKVQTTRNFYPCFAYRIEYCGRCRLVRALQRYVECILYVI